YNVADCTGTPRKQIIEWCDHACMATITSPTGQVATMVGTAPDGRVMYPVAASFVAYSPALLTFDEKVVDIAHLGICMDEIDNDGGGLTDCADPDCSQGLGATMVCQEPVSIVPEGGSTTTG